MNLKCYFGVVIHNQLDVTGKFEVSLLVTYLECYQLDSIRVVCKCVGPYRSSDFVCSLDNVVSHQPTLANQMGIVERGIRGRS